MTVTANKREVAGESTGHSVVYMNPSVCITPCAPSPVPMPYPILTATGTGNLDSDTRRVQIGNKAVFNTDTVIASCNGNEPGTQKEVVSLKTGSSAYMLDGSPDVMIEGKSAVYTGSQGMGNQM